MATFYGAQKSTADGVLSWYDEQDQTNFVIYRHNTKAETARYEGGDKETGMHRLGRFLSEIEPTDYAIYILQLLPSTKKKDATAPCVTFQLYRNQPAQQYAGGPGSYQLNEVVSKLNAIQMRLDSQEAEEDEEEETPTLGAQMPKNPMEVIAGMLMQPQVQNVIVTLLTNMAGNLMKPKPAPVTAVAGVETESTDIAKTLETLFSKGVTPADLEKLAAMDQGQITFLLSMLRK